MSRFHTIFAAAVLCSATVPSANALDKGGYYDASDNPLLGTWLLSAEVINPNFPTHCPTERMAFTPTSSESFGERGAHFKGAAQFIPGGPKSVTVMSGGIWTYILIDHDHILQDQIPRCTWQRGPLNGSTPLIDARYPGAAPGAGAPPPAPASFVPDTQSSPAFNSVDLKRLDEMKKSIDAFIQQDDPKQKNGDQ
jgi:hypothetical protein